MFPARPTTVVESRCRTAGKCLTDILPSYQRFFVGTWPPNRVNYPAALAMPRPLCLTPEEIALAFQAEAWRSQFPPVLTLTQFADLFQVKLRTVKAWISSGDFDGATSRMGKHRRIWRDRAVQIAFSRRRTKPRASRSVLDAALPPRTRTQ